MDNKVIFEKQDMTRLTWSRTRRSSGTAGSFLKAQEEIGGKKIYYKLSDYDSVKGIVGHEVVNEIIVDRLLTILGVEHLEYRLIHADVTIDSKTYETYICASDNFRKPGEEKLALDLYYDLEKKTDESPLDFCLRMKWEKYIYGMLAVDFLILNRDRHGANIEVLRDSKRRKICLAPLFDHGLSLIFSCKNDVGAVKKFQVMEDKKIQCFIGGHSAYENLRLIPKDKIPTFHKLQKSDKNIIFEGLEEILPEIYRNTIWDLIWSRWEFYEDFCNQK